MRFINESDQGLIRQCRTGDARAWERFADRYERLVFSIPLNYGTLMVSLWLVQDETTATFMEGWYRHMHEGLGLASAQRPARG